MNLAALQQQFIAELLGNKVNFAKNVVANYGLNAEQRVSIYSNAYRSRLKETIETDHEILSFYLGDDLFEQMVTGYIKHFPSKYRSLRDFCQHLPEFLQRHQPFAEHPQISELARFERFLLFAFDAADRGTVSLDDLQQVPQQAWPTLTFTLHPSCQLFISDFNVVEIWQALKQQQTPPEQQQAKYYWLLWRNQEKLTEFCSISKAQLSFFQAMLTGNNFSDICTLLLPYFNENDVSVFALNTLVDWLNKGLISDIR